MGTFKEIKGDLIKLAKELNFDAIAQGNNCFCIQGAGIASQFKVYFDTLNPDIYKLEHPSTKGDINKMGQIEVGYQVNGFFNAPDFAVVNCYTQYGMGNPAGDLDYEALTLCMRKLAAKFHTKRIGLPLIGCGIAGGNWDHVKEIIKHELRYCDVTIVHYEP